MKDRKNLFLILCLILVGIFTLTVAYAALNTVLIIQGNAEIAASTWDIHLDNARVISGSVTTNVPTITSGRTLIFNTTLNMPGDYYEFTVDVVNSGSIDAMIDKVTKTPELTVEQTKYLKYEVSYANGESISTKQNIAAGVTMPIKVRVEYRKDLSNGDLPTGQVALNLSLVLDYIQSDGTGDNVTNNGAWIIAANGSLDDIGTIVTIGTEQFYTIGTDGDNVKLLSMYNLYVGNEVIEVDRTVRPWEITMVTLANPTGMQNFNAVGMKSDVDYNYVFPWYGTTAYSSDEQKGINYSDYKGSIVEGYVNNYKTKLESIFDVEVLEARNITYDELTDQNTFACVMNSKCSNKYPWIYSTSYWSSECYGSDSMPCYISSNSYLFYISANVDYNFGVRPVIVISKDYFE